MKNTIYYINLPKIFLKKKCKSHYYYLNILFDLRFKFSLFFKFLKNKCLFFC